MFFDIGWPELLLIGVVALVVIGPKDLPNALRIAGFWFRKARGLSREFQSSVEQMIREAELDEIRKDLKKATEFDIEKEFQQTVDPTGELAQSIKPPDIPDYFDETPKPDTAALPPVDPEPELPFSTPVETAASETPGTTESEPQAALPAIAPEPATGASEAAREAVRSKP